MKLLTASLLSFALGILLACMYAAHSGPVEDFEQGFAAGLPFKEYSAFNAKSSDRTAKVKVTAITLTYVKGYYTESWSIAGVPHESAGVIRLDLKDGQVIGVEQVAIPKDRMPKIDLAVSGQTADLASTGYALSQGLVESNPLSWGIIPAKIAMVHYTKNYPLHECIADRQGLGALGWGLAGWNVALTLSGLYPVALASGAGFGITAAQTDKTDAAFECIDA